MSNHLIKITDERLARLYFEAERRCLDYRLTEANTIEVSSFSRSGLWHRVELIGDEVRCYCEATEACTHIALACSHWFPVTCYLKWQMDESADFINLGYRIRTNQSLTPSEKRKLKKAMRQIEIPQESKPEGAEQTIKGKTPDWGF